MQITIMFNYFQISLQYGKNLPPNLNKGFVEPPCIVHVKSYSKFSKELKNNIQIKVGQAVLELLIQNQHFGCFDLQLKNRLAY